MTSRYVDESNFPVVISTLPPRFTLEELDAFLAQHLAILARGERYGTITDLSNLGLIPDARFRRRVTEWQGEHLPEMRRLTVGTAIVAPTPLLRGALTAIQWVVRAPYPESVVATREEGIAALRRHFEDAGLGHTFPGRLATRGVA